MFRHQLQQPARSAASIESELRDVERGGADHERVQQLRFQLAAAQRRERGRVGVTDIQTVEDRFARPKAPEPQRPGGFRTIVTSTGTERVPMEQGDEA